MKKHYPAAIMMLALVVSMLPRPVVAQELETETARLLRARAIKGGAAFEYQTAAEGQEFAIPMFGEVGITDRLELLVEPVAYTSIRPDAGASASGIGDLEVTLIGLLLNETEIWPALALAGEVKVPTAQNDLIGTGEFDYTGYLILSKEFGQLDTHLNFGYTIVGQPPGLQADNIFSMAVAAKYHLNDRLNLFAEVLGNTSSSAGAEGSAPEGAAAEGTPGATTELAGGELVGTLGASYLVVPSVLLSLGVSYDNNNAVQLRSGFTWRF